MRSPCRQPGRALAGDLRGVERTLLPPLCARALDADRPRPLLRDPLAGALVRELEIDPRAVVRPGTWMGTVLRSNVFDRVVARFLSAHPQGNVVELGAGLSTRFDRIDNGGAWWFEVDLPRVSALRRRCLPASIRRVQIAASLEQSWIGRIPTGPTCFTLEATLAYLSGAAALRLLETIADHTAEAMLVIDTPRSSEGDAVGALVRACPRWHRAEWIRFHGPAPADETPRAYDISVLRVEPPARGDAATDALRPRSRRTDRAPGPRSGAA